MGVLGLAGKFNVIGYVPDYHYTSMSWDNIVQRTTHLVLFSLEPQPDGELKGAQRSQPQLRPLHENFPLLQAVRRAGAQAPKIMIAIGGASRSQHFAAVTSNKQARKKLAKGVVALLKEYPSILGFDLDWETPSSSEHYRDLGKLAADIRKAVEKENQESEVPVRPDFVLSMTYHPLVGQVKLFAGL